MLTTDTNAQFEQLKTGVLEQIERTFPIRDRRGGIEIRVRDVGVRDTLHTDDIRGQAEARNAGKTWGVPLQGTVEFVDTATGETILERPNYTLARIPRLTRHSTYIVGGAEKTIANQWRLRPGAYVKATERDGEFEAQFQLAKGKPFDLQLDPSSRMLLHLGSRKIPAYAVLKGLGVSDDELRSAWGSKILDASKARVDVAKSLRSFYQGWKGTELHEKTDPGTAVKTLLADTRLDPIVAHANLGVDHDHVSSELLLRASKKLIDVAAGRERPDPIDSLRYKELWTAADQFADRIEKSSRDIQSRVSRALEKGKLRERLKSGDVTAVREILQPDLFQRPIAHVFSTSLASNGKQLNPVSLLSDRGIATIMGPGGIRNEHQITESNTAVDPSHLGFVDPVFTPESNVGVSTHLAAGVTIKNRKPVTRLFNVHTKELEEVDAARAAASNVVLPDQVRWKDGVPSPAGDKVRMTDRHGDMRDDIDWKKADYVIPTAAQVFATETNLVPFMQNDSAGRTTMSARHLGQSISVVGREAPKVQVEAGNGRTFEEILGNTFLAHKSPVDGKVKAITSDQVLLEDAAGKTHSVHIYDHYPLNHDKAMLHSKPSVKVGDEVRAGQLVATHNFQDSTGALALGTNLRVAYMSDGFNHEDGITISRSAAKKLSSEHLYKPSLYVADNHIINKKTFANSKPTAFTPAQLTSIGDDGLVKPGTKLKPGDPLVLALSESTRQSAIGAGRQVSRKLQDRYSNSAMVWDSNYEGEVVRVNKKGPVIEVHVKTFEPAQVGSKLSTRHSAKGIVTMIRDDAEMPHSDDGRHVEMLINETSVPGRMNPGQLLETVAGKIAEKTGKPYVVKNFQGGVDYLSKVQADLKKHGLEETEELTDPTTGRKLGKITVGPHYVVQLEHQIDKKTHVRSGGVFSQLKTVGVPVLGYDRETQTPKGGGHHGAQALGLLGTYGALAAGMRNNLTEMQTLKSDLHQAQELWGAIASGTMLPAPKVPFAYKKFEAMLRGMGVNVDQNGAEVRLMPSTDKQTRAWSRGEIKQPTKTIRIKGENDEPEKNGLFDRDITGGLVGEHWGHIELVEPMPHPLHEKSIAFFLGLKKSDIPNVLAGTVKLDDGTYGGAAIRTALSKINVAKTLAGLHSKISNPKTKGEELDKLNAAYKALATVQDAGLTPADAWTIKAVPVLPPVYRPQTTLPDGTQKINPLNRLYQRLGTVNGVLQAGSGKIPYNSTLDARAGLYKELQNLFGSTPKGKKALDLDIRGTREDPAKQLPGILHMLSGDKPKDGFFQDKLLGKKQDYTARVTIVGDPGLSADEIGVPKKVALELFRPFVARRLHSYRAGDVLKIHDMISKKDPVAVRALEAELEHRPVLLKRDPVLHQYGIVGQKVRLTDDAAVKVSPLILPPIGGDIDGDAVVLSVPITQGAVEEAKRIMPSNRMLSSSSGEVLYKPANEAALSLYRMSIPRGKGGHYASLQDAEKAFKDNKLDLNQHINVAGVGDTTLGRLRISQIVPEEFRHDVATNLNVPFDRKYQDKVLTHAAKANPGTFLNVADNMTRLGFRMAYESGHTVALSDIKPLSHVRDPIIAAAEASAAKTKTDADAVKVWQDATDKIHRAYEMHYEKHPNDVSDMARSGIKAKREQFQGLVMAPMLVEDHLGNPSRVPITKSFAEGLDLGGYFLQAAGARRGLRQKTKATAEPGYLTKKMIWSTIDQPITAKDCGTSTGVLLSTKDKDIVDRHLATDVSVGDKTLKAGTVVTPELLALAERNKVNNFVVRSPLKCRMPHGVCSHCMGVHPSGKSYDLGEEVGVIAAQALGERAAQLMLKRTHGAGIVSTKGDTTDSFAQVQRYLEASKPTVENATLAPSDGKVTKVEATNRGGWDIFVSGRNKPLYSRQEPYEHVKPGYQFRRGEQLTAGEANIHHILDTQGLEAVQNHLTKEIGHIYAKEGVLRRHVELLVRNATGIVTITDPGDHPHYIRGDRVMKPVLDEINRTSPKGHAPIRYESNLVAIGQHPLEVQSDWMARLQGENLSKSIVTAVQQGQTTNLTGRHPIPGLAHGAALGARGTVH